MSSRLRSESDSEVNIESRRFTLSRNDPSAFLGISVALSMNEYPERVSSE